MIETLNILLVEDVESDAELVLFELKRAGLGYRSRRVDSETEFRSELEKFNPDLVVSDFSMPQFDGMTALEIVRAAHPDIPFIFVSGTIGESVAVEALKAGASDYVMKGNLARLGPAVRRELREAEVRRAGRAAEFAFRESEAKYRELIGQASDGIFLTDGAGNFQLVNPGFCQMHGYSEEELLRSKWTLIYPDESRDRMERRFNRLREGGSDLIEDTVMRKDGSRFPAETSVKILANGSVQGIVRDVTDRMRLVSALREREAGLRRAQLVAGLAHVVTKPGGAFESWSESLPGLLGVSVEEMPKTTSEWLRNLDPIDQPIFRAKTLEAAATGGRVDVAYRLRRPDDTVVFVRQVIEPLGDGENRGDGKRWFSTLQDVTEQQKDEQKILRLNRVYSVLSGINGVIVRVRDREELFLEVCRIAVEAGGFQKAWVGIIDPVSKRFKFSIGYGAAVTYFDALGATIEKKVEEGRGLVARALREKRAVVVNDLEKEPEAAIKKEALSSGSRSLVVLPLLAGEIVEGVIVLHANQIGIFDDEEMKLLKELAGDIGFALENIRKSETLDYLAYYDALTGLANRTLFHERLTQYVSAASRGGRKLAILMIDIERFKAINDALGRKAGDDLLKQVADRAARYFTDKDWLARLGADHFAAVFPDMNTEDEVARNLNLRSAEIFGTPFWVGEIELRVSAKMGIALYPTDGTGADTLLKNAESALKKSKASGEPYLFYAQQMTDRVAEKLTLENGLRLALERDEFVVHYQPKVNLATGKIVGAEALIRWQKPDGSLMLPLKFIGLLEETGLILNVGTWVLQQAVSDHARLIKQGAADIRLAVNVSPIQLRRADFVDTVRNALIEQPGAPGIDLEITESLMMENIEANIHKLTQVRDMGVNIAIDDFGTGYSSFSYLTKLPVQSLKIDRSFIISMGNNPDAMTIVSSMISLAHALRLKVVAEGVDATEQAKLLKRLRCDEMQGFLFSRAVPLDELSGLIAKGLPGPNF